MVNIEKEDILGYECKHAWCVVDKKDDIIFIKEVIHLKNGKRIPNVRIVKNYQRPFWVTNEAFRNHSQKKEWEDISRLTKYMANQAVLVDHIKRVLKDKHITGKTLRDVCESPYVYGADISPTSIIKKEHYMDKYPDCTSPNTVAVLDSETDVVYGSQDIILLALTMKDKVFVAATKSYVSGIEDFENKVLEHAKVRIPEVIEKRNLNIEVKVVPHSGSCVVEVMKKAHEWMHDFIAVWNLDFDARVMMNALKKYDIDPNEVFSDPRVPANFRKVDYVPGKDKKVTSSGKETPIAWYERWPMIVGPMSFVFIDQACLFRRLRWAKGLQSGGYSLDNILKNYTDTKKLKNDKADTMSGLQWHIYMQQYEKIDYTIYNIYDCISCEILDEQPNNRDLSSALPVQIQYSDYSSYVSQPTRTIDTLHYLCLEHDKVIATYSRNVYTELDEKTVRMTEWIVTLPAHMVSNNGLKCIEEDKDIKTMAYRAVYDLDLTGAYPSGTLVLNTSKETCLAEMMSSTNKLNETIRRHAGLNLTAGNTNAVDICCSMLNAPTFNDLMDELEN